MNKCSKVTQTLHAGYSKADPQTHRQGKLQYTAQLSTRCNDASYVHNGTLENF